MNNEERKKQLSRVELYDTPEHKREQARRLKDKPLKIKLKGVLDQEAKSAPTPGSRAAVRQEQTSGRECVLQRCFGLLQMADN